VCRYYSTFDIPVSYEFGYGLSYTNFNYNNLKLNSEIFNKKLKITIDIVNRGSVSGKEIV